MEEIPPGSLTDWLTAAREQETPTVFRVESPVDARQGGGRAVVDALNGLGAESYVRSDSGAVEFRLYGRGPGLSDDDRVALTAACEAADAERGHYRVVGEERDSEALLLEVESHLLDAGLPSIGPGGRMLVFAGADSPFGEVTIRRRVGEVERPSSWRAPSEIEDRLRTEFDLDRVVVSGELGYFEADSAAAQLLLRPAYLFVLEQEQPEERGAAWRAVRVLAATHVEGLPLTAALGGWAEEEET
jgi:hypothetical protein